MSARFSILEISACLTLRFLASVSWLQREQERGYTPGWARHVWAARQSHKA
jgi:hypothetical protein